MPPTVFGQESTAYLEEKMVTLFLTDNGDWTISNDIDEALAQILDPPSHAISMSVGTASFIRSMDEPEDGSHASTVLEVPTASELEEVARLVI